jgi:3-methyladenine DNA glycosylase AlkD
MSMTGSPRLPADVERSAVEIRRRLQRLGSFDARSLRALRRALTKELAGIPARQLVSLAEHLVDEPSFGTRFIAYELILFRPEALRSLRADDLERLGDGISDWAAVDTFACYLSGPAWREKQIPDGVIRRWARSDDRWWRRAALVSTVPLNNKARGGRGDAARTLRVCEMLIDDRDDMVVKALSWALRELAKRDARSVRAFLSRFGGRLAGRVVREVNNKLSTGLKSGTRHG